MVSVGFKMYIYKWLECTFQSIINCFTHYVKELVTLYSQFLLPNPHVIHMTLSLRYPMNTQNTLKKKKKDNQWRGAGTRVQTILGPLKEGDGGCSSASALNQTLDRGLSLRGGQGQSIPVPLLVKRAVLWKSEIQNSVQKLASRLVLYLCVFSTAGGTVSGWWPLISELHFLVLGRVDCVVCCRDKTCLLQLSFWLSIRVWKSGCNIKQVSVFLVGLGQKKHVD